MGGLGLRSAEHHAYSAFITSMIGFQPIRQNLLNLSDEDSQITVPENLIAMLSTRQGAEVTAESLQGTTQKAASLLIDLHNKELLIETITREDVVREKARLTSLGLPHAGDWLNVLPSPTLGLHMRLAEFVIAVKYRLGVPVFSESGQCPACNHHSDMLGDHAISCGNQGERIARHNSLRDAIFEVTQTACLGATREGRALLPGTEARPADVLIPLWTGGRDTALDMTVINPLQTQQVRHAADKAGAALEAAFTRKMNQAGEACRREGLVFIPMPWETLGGWHEETVNQVKKLASAQARQTGEDQGVVTRHLYQRLSVLLTRGNAALLLNRLPTFARPDMDGVE